MKILFILFLLSIVLVGCNNNNITDEIPEEIRCESDTDCVKDSCCHADSCVNENFKPNCSGLMCTLSCDPGTLDCGQGKCICENNKCSAKIN